MSHDELAVGASLAVSSPQSEALARLNGPGWLAVRTGAKLIKMAYHTEYQPLGLEHLQQNCQRL